MTRTQIFNNNCIGIVHDHQQCRLEWAYRRSGISLFPNPVCHKGKYHLLFTQIHLVLEIFGKPWTIFVTVAHDHRIPFQTLRRCIHSRLLRIRLRRQCPPSVSHYSLSCQNSISKQTTKNQFLSKLLSPSGNCNDSTCHQYDAQRCSGYFRSRNA